ncbi:MULTISPECIES: Rossmann-like and DUF2520 domain-containing protein [Acinetobacter]|uniref:DUF2520 domain-containing protein n=1 Tax=Acinetobacter pseudolwoffii TaxID=2053287 RepID=N9M8C6_9GAMM|nr:MULTISPECIES: Rossmann-like and DUF2520 domain-containing protein [Acinetobacter]ENW86559.1 hypothetical protein F906_01617 [Acinetobacter pseudolwoffii]MCP0910727.1 F420-dependent NADP oxidoreductase [Acinetobacter pseudolwoffii]
MRISIIGAGRVAFHLAQGLNGQHELVQIYSRSFAKAEQLASKFKAQAINAPELLHSEIDLLIIAVSDQSIRSVIEQVHAYLPDVLIVHTSGSTHLNVLQDVHPRSGVFYPLQTFSLERDIDWSNTPLFIEADNAEDQEKLHDLANSLSNRVYHYSSEQRLSLHLAAVFACNFSNYCYDMAKQIVDAEQVDFSLLYPLILETAHKATENDPRQMQTGPAMRGDQNILNMHQQMLANRQRADLQNVYQLLSQQILEHHQK